MFDLEKAVRKWRRGLERGSSLSTRELDELEDHLRARAELETHLNPGLHPARAFATARDELGEGAAVSREFAKAGEPRWRRLLVAGWALFGVSFLLPTFSIPGPLSPVGTPHYGFEVFWKLMWVDGELPNALAALIPNLILLLTLASLRERPVGRRRGLRWAVTTVGLVTLAIGFLMPPVTVVDLAGSGLGTVFAGPGPGIGFWAWSLSFVCAASALWIRDRGGAAVKARESAA